MTNTNQISTDKYMPATMIGLQINFPLKLLKDHWIDWLKITQFLSIPSIYGTVKSRFIMRK
jgi:hypothetical protein